MPTLSESLNQSTDGYQRAPASQPISNDLEQSLWPRRPTVQVCPLPYLPAPLRPRTASSTTVSAERFLRLGPRYPPPQTLVELVLQPVRSSVVVEFKFVLTPPPSQVASISTGPINPGTQFQGTILMAKSFLLYQLAVNGPVRVRLYSTSSSQTADSSRDIFTPVGLGTEQGIISDVVLDTAPVTWQYVDTVGRTETPRKVTESTSRKTISDLRVRTRWSL